MPRRRERSPYQLPLELAARREEPAAVYRALLQNLADETTGSRFVRAVQDEVLVQSPGDAATYLRTQIFATWEQMDQEELWVLLLSTRHRLTHAVLLYRGTVDMVTVRPAEVFKEAIRVNAAGILLSHNHPSGDPTPSSQDVLLTETLVALGDALGIRLVDHIVVGQPDWISLREQQLGFRSK